MKARLIPLFVALSPLLAAGCCQQTAPEGVPRMRVFCQGERPLLFSQRLSSDKIERTPQNAIWLYQPDTDQYEPVFTTFSIYEDFSPPEGWVNILEAQPKHAAPFRAGTVFCRKYDPKTQKRQLERVSYDR